MSTSGISLPEATATPYDFAYDKEAWTPVVVSPILTKPGKGAHRKQPLESRILLPDAYVTIHTTIHRPLDGSSRGSRRKRIMMPLGIVVLLLCLLIAVFFVGRWSFGSASGTTHTHSNSFQCQVSAFIGSVAQLAQGQNSRSYDDMVFACMNPSDNGGISGLTEPLR